MLSARPDITDRASIAYLNEEDILAGSPDSERSDSGWSAAHVASLRSVCTNDVLTGYADDSESVVGGFAFVREPLTALRQFEGALPS